MADPGPPQPLPRKGFARVLLAGRRDVGMGEHALGRDSPAGADVARRGDRRRDLALRKGRRAAVMAGIDDLDPDRGRVEIALAFPQGLARVPRAALSGTSWSDRAILPDQIVRRDLRGRIEQEIERRLARRHAGIVQDEAVGPATAAPLAAIGRREESGRQADCRDGARSCPRQMPRTARAACKPRHRHIDGDDAESAERSVPGGADAVAVGVVAPSHAAPPLRRGYGVADQRAGPGADYAAGDGAAGAAAGNRRANQRAGAGADRAAGEGAGLLLRRLAGRHRQSAGQSQRESKNFLHVFLPSAQ